jgi:hypothetical protein
MRDCEAAASAQTAQECRKILRIRKILGRNNSLINEPGKMISLRK